MKFYILFFLSTLVLATVLNKLLLKFVKSLGVRKDGEQIIRWSAGVKPSIGGIGFFFIFLFSIIMNEILHDTVGLFHDRTFLGILLGSLLAFMLGLSDDAFNTIPLLKFCSQVACGIILIYFDITIDIFTIVTLNYVLTIVWVIGVMNSINMLDNMDGITTVVSISILGMMFFTSIIMDSYENTHIIIFVAMLAALLGFLLYNWNPAKMYMGDTGSQFIGFVLAAFSIIYLWNFENNGTIEPTRNILLVLAAFVLPIADTFTVTINRIIRGISPFVGGKDHTTHHLNYLGCNDMQVGFIFVALSLSSAAVVCWACMIPAWSTINTVLLATYSVIIIIGMYSTTQIKKAKDEFLKHGKS